MRSLLALGLLAAPAGAQTWTPWRALGPFEHEVGEELRNPLDDQLDACAVDGPGPAEREYAGKLGARCAWRPLIGEAGTSARPDVGAIDLNASFPVPAELVGQAWNQQHVVFLHRTVTVDEPRDLELRVGSDDGVFVWWNGALVHSNDVHRGLTMDPAVPARLERGTNHLLVGVTQQGGGWGFRLTTPVAYSVAGVEDAVARGVRWLLDRQLVDGSFGHHEAFGGGNAALGAYVLVKCGLEPTHPAVQRALAWARARSTNYTYSVACEVLALCALKDDADRAWLEERVDTLIELQESSGLYNYPLYPDGTPRPDDLSATVFAAMALNAAVEAGVKVPVKLWRELAEGALRCRWNARTATDRQGREREIAGFTYRPGELPETGSMTTAGVSVLALCRRHAGGKLSRKARAEVEEACAQGLAWIEHHWTLDENPGGGHHYYFVYGIERVAALLELDRIAGFDWYEEGASFLLEQQQPDGAWPGPTVDENTLLALLFLERATAPASGRRTIAKSWALDDPGSPVRWQARGDAPTTAFLSGFAPEVVARHGRGPDGELFVERVDYLARPADGAGEPTVVASAAGDPAEPATLERFPVRIDWPENGRFALHVRVVLAPDPTADAPVAIELVSSELVLPVEGIVDPEQLAYADDEGRNELLDRDVAAEASSSAGPGFEASRAVDGTHATRWLCAGDDREPRLSLEWGKPIAAEQLLLSHAYPRGAERDVPRVARVRVTPNGKGKQACDYALDLDPLRKTRIPLGGARLRSLELEVLELTSGPLGSYTVGFSEVELVR